MTKLVFPQLSSKIRSDLRFKYHSISVRMQSVQNLIDKMRDAVSRSRTPTIAKLWSLRLDDAVNRGKQMQREYDALMQEINRSNFQH